MTGLGLARLGQTASAVGGSTTLHTVTYPNKNLRQRVHADSKECTTSIQAGRVLAEGGVHEGERAVDEGVEAGLDDEPAPGAACTVSSCGHLVSHKPAVRL
jgi:hypothetical protein